MGWEPKKRSSAGQKLPATPHQVFAICNSCPTASCHTDEAAPPACPASTALLCLRCLYCSHCLLLLPPLPLKKQEAAAKKSKVKQKCQRGKACALCRVGLGLHLVLLPCLLPLPLPPSLPLSVWLRAIRNVVESIQNNYECNLIKSVHDAKYLEDDVC